MLKTFHRPPPPLALLWCKLLFPYEYLNTFFSEQFHAVWFTCHTFPLVASWAQGGSEWAVVRGGGVVNDMNNAEVLKDPKWSKAKPNCTWPKDWLNPMNIKGGQWATSLTLKTFPKNNHNCTKVWLYHNIDDERKQFSFLNIESVLWADLVVTGSLVQRRILKFVSVF